ncbi:HoxN/HupN/NixA family nickel/cobalt transporter [Actinoplanes aureus]|uniref:SDR family NAD(P)-dependent oxidoreductase n=1 Tax=Actinoplanes aureus TaxID=2792083 RepID=A0A931C8S9_9ACTN|nr:SDR family NAD(P)-dependent oxidoreductase [Actinoplanes aureus]MBG0565520.1 SDR family NAD(P)-dependent oxidoreductase [Actinoplanes aureus]
MADYRTGSSRLRYNVDGTDQRSLAGMAAVVVLLHLAGFGLLFGLLLPDGYQLGDDRQGVVVAAGIVAYVLGLRRAFDPRHLTAVGDSAAELARRGRRSPAVGFWFALGYAASVTALTLLLTMGVQGFAWWRGLDGFVPRLIVDAADAGVFLGILGVLSMTILFGAVRRRRGPAAGEPPGNRWPVGRFVDRLIEWVRSPWQLFVVGLLFGAGLGIAAEAALLVLATGMALFVLPAYPVVVVPVLFAAGMCLGGAVQGVLVIDPYGTPEDEQARGGIYQIGFAAFAGLMALAVSVSPLVGELPEITLPGGLAGNIDLTSGLTDGPLVEIAQVLVSWPVLIVLLLVAAVVAAFVIRRRRGERDGRAGATGSSGDRARPAAAAGDRARPVAAAGDRGRPAAKESRQARAAAKREAREANAAARREAREARAAEKREVREANAAVKWEAREATAAARREARMAAAASPSARRPEPAPDPRRSGEPSHGAPARGRATVQAAAGGGGPAPQPVARQPVAPHPVAPQSPAPQSVAEHPRAIAQVPVSNGGPTTPQPHNPAQHTLIDQRTTDDPGTQALIAPITAQAVAVVTAAGAGLGRAIASGLASAGYGIVAVDTDPGSAEACATQVRAFGVPARALRADIRDPRYLDRIVDAADELGGPGVLVNSVSGSGEEMTAAMLVSQHLLEPMRAGGGGEIVNVVSAPEAEDRLIRFTASLAGPAQGYGVRAMCVTADPRRTHPADLVTAVLDLIQLGRAGAVVQMQAVGFRPGVVRGSAPVG